jgi:hypothetical protein
MKCRQRTMFKVLILSRKEIQGKEPQEGKDNKLKAREPPAGDCTVICLGP